ncbi:hypothetical protein LPB03_12125 [Polaribacter vadi]|uniref:Thioredoxin domain-containing protein n=1 Tax=Polaribacter vadi TaxID=1774273 RepID=A0A1B8TT98_9FLAO|nr:TlpA disulfide reductase family protein [Polaribacter vadi]AOW18154.1 hypothetical protein LPB03_12125 [Polaribacter vadi]OBY62883.1 hypothetical protein LPB3_12140 [Polaribacter vadi]
MNIIANIKEETIQKLKILVLLLLIFFTTSIQAQKTSDGTQNIETQSDKDWNELYFAMAAYGTVAEEQAALKESALKLQQYYDKYFSKRSRLAKAFFENYPEDKRHDQALNFFFDVGAEPHFIPKVISDSLEQVLAAIPRKDHTKFKRLLPVDYEAWKQWLKTGDDMVASVINSNSSLERKEVAEFQLIAREFRKAIKFDNALTKEKSESDFWNRFEIHYWGYIRLLLENHFNKYASLEVMRERIQNILSLLKHFSSAASNAYWKYFFETTGSNHPQSDQLGIKAIHELAAENVAAIDALKEVDYSKPLELSFTAMDGNRINLEKMKGKVVLIDFWATYCSPCIKEMPHVRAMYDKYKDLGFEVIGIAADNDVAKSRISDILKKTGANWPQRLDKGSDVSVSFHTLYEIKALPTVWLLNKEGVIVDRNARGERLEPLIRKYLGLKN